MRVINEYGPFKVNEEIKLDHVRNVLKFAVNPRGEVAIWCEVDLEGPTHGGLKTLLVVTSGQHYETDWRHVETVTDGLSSYHLLEERNWIQEFADKIF